MSREYPSDWNTRRKEVYKRDDYTCQNCGAKGGPKGDAELHAHHVVPKSKGGTHKKSNLKTVCKDCHDAIHGETMAPPSEKREKESQERIDFEFPINVDKYPQSLSLHITCANTIAEIYDNLERISDEAANLMEYSEMYNFIGEDDVPKRLEEKYESSKRNVDSELTNFGDNHNELKNVSEEGFESEETREIYRNLIKKTEYLSNGLEEYYEYILELSESDNLSESYYIELQLLSNEIEDNVEDIDNIAKELEERLSTEIRNELKRFDRGTTIFADPPDICPICGGNIQTRRFRKANSNVSFGLVRCSECQTEWLGKPFELEVIYSDYDIEGYSIAPAVWQKAYNEGYKIPSGLSKYQAMSDKYISKKKRYFGLFALLEIVVVLWAYSVGSFLFFGVATIVVSALVGGLFGRARSTILGSGLTTEGLQSDTA